MVECGVWEPGGPTEARRETGLVEEGGGGGVGVQGKGNLEHTQTATVATPLGVSLASNVARVAGNEEHVGGVGRSPRRAVRARMCQPTGAGHRRAGDPVTLV